MCFKAAIKKSADGSTSLLNWWIAVLIFSCSLFPLFGKSEVIDRILAVVNDQIITLTDVVIAESFGIYREADEEHRENARELILEKMIDQKLIIQLTGEEDAGGEKEIEEEIERIRTEIGSDAFNKTLKRFGLGREDIGEYIREKLLYERIIAKKFSRSIPVSLEEIRTYYETNYVPSQKEEEDEIQPMAEMLDVIEQAIKKEKIEKQVAEWVGNLRRKAEIQVKYKSEK